MSGLANNDWIGLVVFVISTYGQIGYGDQNGYQDYQQRKGMIRGSPPGWVFGVAWSVLYGLISAAGFLYWLNYPAITSTRNAILILFFINLVLNKIWTPLFFGANRKGLAFFDLVLTLGTSIAVVVLFGIEQAWLSFGLYIAYPVWLLYAGYLNLQWWRLNRANGPINMSPFAKSYPSGARMRLMAR